MLSRLQLKSIYNTLDNDIANDFYIPVLAEAISYKRVSGYFSSSALSFFASGIEQLAYNNGKYQLLISNQVSEEDFNQMKKGYYDRKKIQGLISTQLSDYKELDSEQKRKFANMSYLIEVGILDIKIAFTKQGLFHSKYGIITDEENNKVYFSGSFNETAAAFNSNFESITLIKSWTKNSDNEVINKENDKFDDLWNNKHTDVLIIKEVDEILKSQLVSFSKGKLIMDFEQFTEDALILYYDQKLMVKDNLVDGLVNKHDRRIRKLQKLYLIDSIFWNFKENLNIKDLNRIINLLQMYGNKNNVNVVLSNSITSYIDSRKFELEEISKRGLLIKNKDDSMLSKFEYFNQIVSNEVARKLRTIQTWVSFYMATMIRVGNFSVPGAGKTAMMLGTFAYLSSKEVNLVDKIVVIGPKNSFKSWKDEFKAVFGEKRELKILDIHASDFDESLFEKNTNDYNLILVNYESLNKYRENLQRLINTKTLLIFDEVHKIKGENTVGFNNSMEIAKEAKYRYVLSGTPIPNKYSDVWNFLHVLYEEEYDDYFEMKRFELDQPDDYKKKEFDEKLFPLYWRVTKDDLEVPPVNEDHLYKFTATYAEQEVLNLLWRKYGQSPFVLYTRLIQFSSNPKLLLKSLEKNQFLDDDTDYESNLTYEYLEEMNDYPAYSESEITLINSVSKSTKFEGATQKATSLVQEGKTVVIWCIFIDTMLQLVDELEKKGLRVAIIYGAISAPEREKIISNFQNGQFDILITNPHTLAESVSLHKVCHDAIYLEYSFNLTHMLQSRDRIHRLGLDDNDETNYYYFMLEGQEGQRNTIDLKVYNRLKEKEKVMINTIEGTQIGVEFSMSEKDEILEMMTSDN